MLIKYKERNPKIIKILALCIALVFILDETAFGFMLSERSDTKSLSPESRFNPAKETTLTKIFSEYATTRYFKIIISNFIKRASCLSELGMSEKSVLNHLDSLINDLFNAIGPELLTDREVALIKEFSANEHEEASAREIAIRMAEILTGRLHPLNVRAKADTDVIHEKTVRFSKKEHEKLTVGRVSTRQILKEGISLEWAPKPMPKPIPARIQNLIDTVVQRRIDWRIAEGFDYNVADLKKETINGSLTFVINEILTNAFDAFANANTEGPISFRILRDGTNGNIIIDISDDGIGIDKIVNMPEIFTIIHNPAPSGHAPLLEGGRSIGLMWSMITIELHGGKIEPLKNVYDGYKTTVRITLPENSVRIKKLSSGQPASAIAIIEEIDPAKIIPLAINSLSLEGTSAFFTTLNNERVLAVTNKSTSTREGAVIIPLKMLAEYWPEVAASFTTANTNLENLDNFMIEDANGHKIKFIAGANSHREGDVLRLYFKLIPGKSHIFKLKTTEVGIAENRPWNIPGVDMNITLPDDRSISIEETLFVEPLDINFAADIQAMLAKSEKGERFFVIRNIFTKQDGKTARASVHIPLDLIPEIRRDIESGDFLLTESFSKNRSKRVIIGDKRGAAKIEANTLKLPVQLRPGESLYYSLSQGMENNVPAAPLSDDDTAGRIQEIDLTRERSIAIDYKDAIIDMAVKARDKGETIILGLDTTWIPGGSGSSALLAEINNLPGDLRRRGLDNAFFEYGKGDDAALKVLLRQQEYKTKFSNIIIIGAKDILESKEFNKLRGISEEDSALLIGVDPGNLKYTSGVRIPEMYLLAMALNYGKDPSQLDQTFITIRNSPNGKLRSFIFTPIKPHDLEEFKAIYELQIREINIKA